MENDGLSSVLLPANDVKDGVSAVLSLPQQHVQLVAHPALT